jgi:hypothetical protein
VLSNSIKLNIKNPFKNIKHSKLDKPSEAIIGDFILKNNRWYKIDSYDINKTKELHNE